MGRKIIAATIGYTDPDTSPQGNVLYVATEGLTTGAGDTPANTWFQGKLSGDISYKWQVAAPFTRSRPVAGIGVLNLINDDGGLDSANAWDFRDGAVTLKMLDPGQDWSAGTTIATAIVESTGFDAGSNLRLVLRDTSSLLEQPISRTVYGEGEAAGLIHPLHLGIAYSIPPILTATAVDYWLYSATSVLIASPDVVRDNGKSITFTDANGGFSLDAAPAGKLTCDYTSLDSDFETIIANTINKSEHTFTVDSASQTMVNDLGYKYGWWVGTSVTIADVLYQICASHNGWYYINRSGDLAFGYLKAPESTATVNFDTGDIIEIVSHYADYAPGLSNRMGAVRNWEVLSLESIDPLAGSEEDRIALSRTHQHNAYSTITLADRYAHAESGDVMPSLFTGSTDADNETDRLTGIFSINRTTIIIDVALDMGKFDTIEIGDTVSVDAERLGIGSDLFDSGFSDGFLSHAPDNCLLLGIEGNFTQNKMRLKLWN